MAPKMPLPMWAIYAGSFVTGLILLVFARRELKYAIDRIPGAFALANPQKDEKS